MIHVLHRYELIQHNAVPQDSLYLLVQSDGVGGCSIKVMNGPSKTPMFDANMVNLEEAMPVPVFYNSSTEEFIEFTDSYTRRDLDSFMRAHQFARFAFSMVKFAGDLYVILGMPVLADINANVQQVSNLMSTIRVVESISPKFGEHPNVKKRRAKYDVMHNVNHLDSLADLEKHVDLLSELVLAIAKLIPEEHRPAMTAVIERIMQHSSTSQKSVEECADDVVKQKAHIRKQLSRYYEAKKPNA